jgi:hypothetical protein
MVTVKTETSELPANCRTKLECRTCKGEHFRVCWNWTPVDSDGPAVARWEINCVQCGETWTLEPGGLPNPGEIHDAQVDVRLFQGDCE